MFYARGKKAAGYYQRERLSEMQDYAEFLKSKSLVVQDTGLEVKLDELNSTLFGFQKAICRWSLLKGRACVMTDTGLGKTRKALANAEILNKKLSVKTLILTPLATTEQFVAEGVQMGISVKVVRNQTEVGNNPIVVCNYEMLGKLDVTHYQCIILDEGSILKTFDGKTRTELIKLFKNTPFRFVYTATPAPNEIEEFGSYAEFFGIMSYQEMLSTFFYHDDTDWKIKGHADSGPFWEWLASWSIAAKKPSDLGFSDEGYVLPGLEIKSAIVEADYIPEGKLFADKLRGVTERAQARKSTTPRRVEETARIVADEPNEQWLIWCGTNAESEALKKAIPDAVEVQGSDKPESKIQNLMDFASGKIKILITKPSIAGFGMNFQRCARMIFCGLGDSYEQYYQAIRRCYRFGQWRKVIVHIVLSDIEQEIYYNVLRKEKNATRLSSELTKRMSLFSQAEITATTRSEMEYHTNDANGNGWKLMLGDSAERLQELETGSVDLAVFSQPFLDVYSYNNSRRSLENCKNPEEFWQHFSYINRELLRVMRPGRIVAAHVQQIATQKNRHGFIGFIDFRGQTIQHFTSLGFIYHGEICVDRDPQAQAIRLRGRAKGLRFAQKDKDRSWLRPAMADYILLFRAPGENAVPIVGDVSNEQWIEWARPVWYDIDESTTLNANAVAKRDPKATKHPCPLQLDTIGRCIGLWSNPGETVLSPFAGLGSEIYQAVKMGRIGVGSELNPLYFEEAVKNVREAERLFGQRTLFDFASEQEDLLDLAI